ncbi:High-affinity nitrate transporter 3.1 [Linum perenne]
MAAPAVARPVLLLLASTVVVFSCLVSFSDANELFSTLQQSLFVTASPTSGQVLKGGEDKIKVTWGFNKSSSNTDGKFKNIKVKLCYAPISQKDRPWRKTEDHITKDKTCQFDIVTRPYTTKSSANQSIDWLVEKDVPTATYFVRAYAVDAAGKEVAYGQSTNAKKTTNLFQVEAVSGRHATLDIVSVCFSVFSIVSLFGLFYNEKLLLFLVSTVVVFSCLVSFSDANELFSTLQQSLFVTASPTSGQVLKGGEDKIKKDRPWRKTEDHITNDKTCQFDIVTRPYTTKSSANQSIDWLVEKDVPTATYFVRAYAVDAAGKEVAYGQSTNAKKTTNLFQVEAVSGRHATLDIVSVCFSVFSIVSLFGLFYNEKLFSCLVSFSDATELFSTLQQSLFVTASPTSGQVLKGGEDKIKVTWGFNKSSSNTDGKFKNIKVKLCYAPISYKDRPWRKTEDHITNDKTCQFDIVTGPYNTKSSANQSIDWLVEKDVPTATYFVRAYAVDAAGKEVAYGQSTNAKKTTNLFQVEAVSGRHATLDIVSVCFSVFSIVSLFGLFYNEKLFSCLVSFSDANELFSTLQQSLFVTASPTSGQVLKGGEDKIKKDRPWRKTENHITNDKTCQFDIVTRPYTTKSSANQSIDWLVEKDVPTATYFVRAYAVDAAGKEVAYGQSTNAKKTTNLFQVEAVSGRHATLDIVSVCFSVFSIVSLFGLFYNEKLFSCLVSFSDATELFSTLQQSLFVTASPTSGQVLKGGEDKIKVTWGFNKSSSNTDGKFKNIKVKLCYAPISYKDRPWRKTEDHITNDKTCQFDIVTGPYNTKSSANQSIDWLVEKDVPTATYFVRAYAVDAAGKEVAYGQSTNAKKTTNLFQVEAVSGRHATLDIVSVCFSVFSIVSLFGLFYNEKLLLLLVSTVVVFSCLVSFSDPNELFSTLQQSLFVTASPTSGQVLKGGEDKIKKDRPWRKTEDHITNDKTCQFDIVTRPYTTKSSANQSIDWLVEKDVPTATYFVRAYAVDAAGKEVAYGQSTNAKKTTNLFQVEAVSGRHATLDIVSVCFSVFSIVSLFGLFYNEKLLLLLVSTVVVFSCLVSFSDANELFSALQQSLFVTASPTSGQVLKGGEDKIKVTWGFNKSSSNTDGKFKNIKVKLCYAPIS